MDGTHDEEGSATDQSTSLELDENRSTDQNDAMPSVRLEEDYWRNIARIGIQVAEALAHSHAHGIIHRDVKPGNLLLDEEGVVWVTDFGLAVTEESTITQTGDVVGTLRYLSPERFSGKCRDKSDIYSLGITLYEFLTVRQAFESSSQFMLIELIHSNQLVPPRTINPRIPRDLETIILKACEKDPEDRYTSASAVAQDLQRFLDDKPILARQVSRFEQLMRWRRRNKSFAASLTAVAALLCLLTIGSLLAANYYRSQRTVLKTLSQKNELEAKRARAAEAEIERSFFQAQMRMAGDIMKGTSGTDRVLELTDRWIPDGSGRDLRGWEWYFLRSLCHRERLNIDTGQYWLWSVAWSPDGSKLATSGDGTVKIWNPQNGTLQQQLDLPRAETSAASWSPSGSQLATAAGRDIVIWNVDTDLIVRRIENAHEKNVNVVKWSPDGTRIATGGAEGKVRVWDVQEGKELIVHEQIGAVFTLDWSPDSRLIVYGGEFKAIFIFDSSTGEKWRAFARHVSEVTCIKWNPDGKHFVSCGRDQAIHIWLTTASVIRSYARPDRVHSVSWDPAGERIVAGSWEGIVVILEPSALRKVQHLFGHEGRIWAVEWHPDGKQFASVTIDGELKIWETSVPDESKALTVGERGFEKIAWSSDGKCLAASNEEQIVVWDSTEKNPRFFDGPSGVLTSLRWNSAGTHLASTSDTDTTKIWNAESGTLILELNTNGSADFSVAWSPDGDRIATANKNALAIHNASTGEIEQVLMNDPMTITAMDWSGTSQQLACGGADGTIKIWDVDRGERLYELTGHDGEVTSVRWNGSGTQLASAGRDRTVRIWEGDQLTSSKVLRGHTRRVNSVCWHPDDVRLASGSEDETVRIWDGETGSETLALKLHTSNVTSVDWNVDGDRLASGSWDATVRIWDATRGYQSSESR